MIALTNNNSEILLNHGTLLLLFDCYVGGIINYASEIWGIQKGNYAEKTSSWFRKQGGNRSAFYALVCTALGRPPLITNKKKIFSNFERCVI